MRLAVFSLMVLMGSVAALACSDDSSDGGGTTGGTAGTGGTGGTGGGTGGGTTGGTGGGTGGGTTGGTGGGTGGGVTGGTGGNTGGTGGVVTGGTGGDTGGTGGDTGGTGGDTGGTGGDTGGTGGDTGGTGGGAGTPGNLPFGHPDPTATYPEYPGFTLWLVEEFNEALNLDTDPIWTWSDGALGEGLIRYHRDGISFADGTMRLTVEQMNMPGSCSHAEYANVGTYNLRSGELRTRLQMFRYGRYETSLKGPSPNANDSSVNGNYISAFFLFRNPKFQEWREIDIELTGDSGGSYTTNLIYGNNQTGWSAGIQEAQSHTASFNARDDFHTYAFEWLPTGITWFVDGQQVRQKSSGSGLAIPERSVKILANFWIFNGTGFGGTQGANNQYPMQSQYDWIRFYKWDDDADYPCMAMDESCLAADGSDLDMASNNPCDGLDPSGTTPGGPACQGTCDL